MYQVYLNLKVTPPDRLYTKHGKDSLNEVEDWRDNPDDAKAKNTQRSRDDREGAETRAATIIVQVDPIGTTHINFLDFLGVKGHVAPQKNAPDDSWEDECYDACHKEGKLNSFANVVVGPVLSCTERLGVVAGSCDAV